MHKARAPHAATVVRGFLLIALARGREFRASQKQFGAAARGVGEPPFVDEKLYLDNF